MFYLESNHLLPGGGYFLLRGTTNTRNNGNNQSVQCIGAAPFRAQDFGRQSGLRSEICAGKSIGSGVIRSDYREQPPCAGEESFDLTPKVPRDKEVKRASRLRSLRGRNETSARRSASGPLWCPSSAPGTNFAKIRVNVLTAGFFLKLAIPIHLRTAYLCT